MSVTKGDNMDINLVKEVSCGISNFIYHGNIQATEELINLFNHILRCKPQTAADYIEIYDNSFYTYRTWKELIDSEIECDGLTEDECRSEIGKSIWQLPCGWFIQQV